MQSQASLDRGWPFVVVCASGPSFTPDQQAQVIAARERGEVRVIVVNNQYQYVPNADALYAADALWWSVHDATINASRFAGERWTQGAVGGKRAIIGNRGEFIRVETVASIVGNYLPADPLVICQGGNSGFQALSLAVRFGARRIVLCGFDMRRLGAQKHNHPDHKAPLTNGNPVDWVKHFTRLASDLDAAGVDVVNCSDSAITAFRCVPLSVALSVQVTA